MNSNNIRRSIFIMLTCFTVLLTFYYCIQKEVGTVFVKPRIKTTYLAPTTTTVRNCQRINQLKQVLIAINFNSPYYAWIPLLKRVYGPVFGKIVFCGTKIHDDVIKIEGRFGYQGYECLATAIRMFGGNYSGYIHSNDDVLFHWWNFKDYDLTKLLPGFKVNLSRSHEFKDSFKDGWMWWSYEKAEERCKSAFYAVLNFSRTQEGRRLNMKQYVERYFENTGNRKVCFHAWSDFFYVPREFAELYAALSRIYSKHFVFLEVAVPLIHMFFMNPTNHEYFNGIYLPKKIYSQISLKVPFYHPFKLSHDENRNFMENIVTSHGALVRLYCRKVLTSKK